MTARSLRGFPGESSLSRPGLVCSIAYHLFGEIEFSAEFEGLSQLIVEIGAPGGFGRYVGSAGVGESDVDDGAVTSAVRKVRLGQRSTHLGLTTSTDLAVGFDHQSTPGIARIRQKEKRFRSVNVLCLGCWHGCGGSCRFSYRVELRERQLGTFCRIPSRGHVIHHVCDFR